MRVFRKRVWFVATLVAELTLLNCVVHRSSVATLHLLNFLFLFMFFCFVFCLFIQEIFLGYFFLGFSSLVVLFI